MGLYCVYEHVFPNGKKYIGISKDPELRWMKNGRGYANQQKMFRAINKYGWENIQHNIIIDDISEQQAKQLEMYLIKSLDTIENGYNTTIGGDNIKSTFLNSHVLAMIRESKDVDEKLGEVQNDDDIVSMAEKAKYNSELAELFNRADALIQEKYYEYKFYHGGGNPFDDMQRRRIDCYWWTVIQLISSDFTADLDPNERPYSIAWFKELSNDGNADTPPTVRR